MPGPLPSENHSRPGRTKKIQGQYTTYVRTGTLNGPDLVTLSGVSDWSPQTISWFNAWRAMPQSEAFEPTDWQRLALVAYMVERYVESPRANNLAEIRTNESLLGATLADRIRLRLKFEDPSPIASVTALPTKGASLASRLAQD